MCVSGVSSNLHNISFTILNQFLSIELHFTPHYTYTKKNRYISSPLPLKQIVWTVNDKGRVSTSFRRNMAPTELPKWVDGSYYFLSSPPLNHCTFLNLISNMTHTMIAHTLIDCRCGTDCFFTNYPQNTFWYCFLFQFFTID